MNQSIQRFVYRCKKKHFYHCVNYSPISHIFCLTDMIISMIGLAIWITFLLNGENDEIISKQSSVIFHLSWPMNHNTTQHNTFKLGKWASSTSLDYYRRFICLIELCINKWPWLLFSLFLVTCCVALYCSSSFLYFVPCSCGTNINKLNQSLGMIRDLFIYCFFIFCLEFCIKRWQNQNFISCLFLFFFIHVGLMRMTKMTKEARGAKSRSCTLFVSWSIQGHSSAASRLILFICNSFNSPTITWLLSSHLSHNSIKSFFEFLFNQNELSKKTIWYFIIWLSLFSVDQRRVEDQHKCLIFDTMYFLSQHRTFSYNLINTKYLF